jgi:glycosyltransferase involved in cell wall biosynthesis
MPFISVVIPLYNKEQYIENTLQSVLSQTFIDYEIIIVNDGSSDNSLSLISKYNLENLTIINQKNSGLSASRNKGFASAKGSVIAFLDADDIWYPDFLKTIKSLHDEFPEANIFGTSYFEKRAANKLNINVNIEDKLKNKSFIIEDFFKANTKQFIPCQSSVALKKKAFTTVPYNENITYHEDVDFYLKYCADFKIAIKYQPLVDVNFLVNGQMSKSNISKKQTPDLNLYQAQYAHNKSIIKYIDLQRYKYFINFKLHKEINLKNKIIEEINFDHLTITQKIMIKIPRILLVIIKNFKSYFLNYKIRLNRF